MRNVFKKEDGITLITLTVAVAIFIIITSLLIYNAKNGIRMRNLKMMQNDIELLDDKIDAYYVKYGKLPLEIRYQGNIYFTPGENDNDIYYVIDLKALEGLSLNYGDDFSKINSEDDTLAYDDIYIINEQSHHIYYSRGIEMDGMMYYTNEEDDEILLLDTVKFNSEENILIGHKMTLELKSLSDIKSKTFSSSNDSIVTVDSSTGEITGVSAGNATITVTATKSDDTIMTKTCVVTVNEGVIKIASTGIHYENLENAIDTALDGDEIVAVQNYTDNSSVSISKNLTINTNGKKIIRTATITINSGYTVTLSGEGTLTTESAIDLIVNMGTLNISHTGEISNTNSNAYVTISNAGTVNKTGSGTISSSGTIATISGGIINISNGTVNSSGGKVIFTTGNVSVSGGMISSTSAEAISASGAEVRITGGTIQKSGNNSGAALAYSGTGTAILAGGTLQVLEDSGSTVIWNSSTGTMSIEGALIKQFGRGHTCMNYSSGIINVNAGSITNSSTNSVNAIYNNSTGTINVSGGTISGPGGIYNLSSGKIIVSGGNITATSYAAINLAGEYSTVTVHGGTIVGEVHGIYIYNNNCKVEILGGNITGVSSGGVTSVSSHNGTVVYLGEEATEMDQTNPLLIGGYGGIYCGNATVYYYNGKILGGHDFGTTKGYSAGTMNVRSGYSINNSSTETIDGVTYYKSYLINN